MRYLPNSDADRAAMLQETGHGSMEELFAQVPAELRIRGRLNLPGPLSEPEILEFFSQAAAQSGRDYVSLLGAGACALPPRRCRHADSARRVSNLLHALPG